VIKRAKNKKIAVSRIPKSIDQYIAGFPPDVREILQRIRNTARRAAPQAEEIISYRMPAFRQNGILIYFAAFKGHIGLYPPVRGDDGIVQEASVYAGEKGNLRFQFDRPIPYTLIGRIVKLRVKQEREKLAVHKKRK